MLFMRHLTHSAVPTDTISISLSSLFYLNVSATSLCVFMYTTNKNTGEYLKYFFFLINMFKSKKMCHVRQFLGQGINCNVWIYPEKELKCYIDIRISVIYLGNILY